MTTYYTLTSRAESLTEKAVNDYSIDDIIDSLVKTLEENIEWIEKGNTLCCTITEINTQIEQLKALKQSYNANMGNVFMRHIASLRAELRELRDDEIKEHCDESLQNILFSELL